MKNDVVYIVRGGKNEELRYSLRSVEQNFPHRDVCIYGGKPKGIKADINVQMEQYGRDKWEKVRNTLKEICKNDLHTENIWLFNDDFFIMQPVKKPANYYDGTLAHQINVIEAKVFGRKTQYSVKLRHLLDTLRKAGVEQPLNYAHHTPMLINRKKMLETLEAYHREPMFRALYGNLNHIGGVDMPDVKFYGNRQPWPIGTYASTADESWLTEKIGFVIRDKFRTPSRWEEDGRK